MKKPITVHFTVMVDDKELLRLEKEGREEGNGYDDAGPILTIQRYLMDVGLEGAFQKQHSLGLEFILNYNPEEVTT